MYAQERQRQVLDALEQSGRVTVSDLAERFDVTTETVRRDLDDLERRGLLARVHGGAIARRTRDAEPDLDTRRTTNTQAKRRIADAARALLPTDPEASVLLDAGTTTLSLVPHLAERTGPVLTHALDVAQAALGLAGPPVHVLPGRLRPGTGAGVGAETVSALARLRPEVAFLGCNGFDGAELFTPDPEEGAVKSAIVERAGRRVLLADSSKAQVRQLVAFARTGDIDALVTDSDLPEALRSELEGAGTEVVFA
ncbi:DeoR/GlpR transcriptional regulator [Brachybacterium sp. MASK1Z-5]|uniref:Lactose phosphotransferase system repressor n=1 Tax=Brachybacterium halotolerans TaxID=2795215 RepID=A0ABS1B8Z8_9MICO|nr:DeoR/GlpR family DNA-binding transcription regulator [Brachybacterium halotolerans]MBK0331080.1 DeoR/GlpR transcriptional regulator [Brachybacterium halotolerans]